MDIHATPGTPVRFTNAGGLDKEQSEALGILELGRLYTVAQIEIGGWSSRVELREMPGQRFNTVLFEDA